MSFDPDEIDKERGVILEEWRVGRGADARMQDAQFPVLLKGSRYAERMPIGTPEIIRNFKYDRLKQFYKDWYRPDLMAVIAVGDFDQARMESLINRTSGRSRGHLAEAADHYDVPDQPGTRYAIATETRRPTTIVGVTSLMAARDQTTLARTGSRRSRSSAGCSRRASRRSRRSRTRRSSTRKPSAASS